MFQTLTSGYSAPRAEREQPIEIQEPKFLEWLVSRRKVPRDWSARLAQVRGKLAAAVELLRGAHPACEQQLAPVLEAPYLSYFHARRIFEALLTTENTDKALFGGYNSPLLSAFDAVLKAYQTNDLFLAEAARVLNENITAQIPTVRRNVERMQRNLTDIQHKDADLRKSIANQQAIYERICEQYEIKGLDVAREIRALPARKLPASFAAIVAAIQCDDVHRAIEYYSEFSRFLLARVGRPESTTALVPTLSLLHARGDVELPELLSSVEYPISSERLATLLSEAHTTSAALTAQTSNDEAVAAAAAAATIDWSAGAAGDGADSAAINWDVSAGAADDGAATIQWDVSAGAGAAGDAAINWDVQSESAGAAAAAAGDAIQWDTAASSSSAAESDATIQWDFDVVRGSGAEQQDAPSAAAAAAAAAAAGMTIETTLSHQFGRYQLLSDLQELEAFLSQRIAELGLATQDVVTMSPQCPQILLRESRESLDVLRASIAGIIAQLTDEHVQRLLMIRSSDKLADRVATDVRRPAELVRSLSAALVSLAEKRSRELAETRAELPKLQQYVRETLELRRAVEQEISAQYDNRPVSIFGEISELPNLAAATERAALSAIAAAQSDAAAPRATASEPAAAAS